MITLFLEPLDVWLFRDGRPFTAGQQFRAASRFPPSPLVMQGALRTYFLENHANVPLWDNEAIAAVVGSPDDWGPLRARGPLVARALPSGECEILLPPPADAVGQAAQLRRLPCPEPPPPELQLEAPTPRLFPLWEAELQGDKTAARLWLRLDDFVPYTRGETVGGVPETELWTSETRIGIAQESGRRTVREGFYYEVSHVRPHPGVGLLVLFQGLDWPDQEGILALGGERRAARFTAIAPPQLPAPPDPLPEQFTLYFLTPAIFEQGWRPTTWSTYFQGDVELVAAAVERAEIIGGFNLARGEERPARRAVPAGSVYYFEAKTPSRVKQRDDLDWFAISDWGAEIGFGTVVIGEW